MYAGKLLFMDGGNLFTFEWLAMASISLSIHCHFSRCGGVWGDYGSPCMALPTNTTLLFFDLFFPPPTQLSAAPIHTTFPPRSAINGNFRMIKVHG